MNCKYCKAEMPDNSVFCPMCGKKQTGEKRKELKKPNGYGGIVKLSGRRRKPWAVCVTDAIIDGKQIRRYVSYHETKTEALRALANEQINPSSPRSTISLKDLYEEWKQTKAFTALSQSTKYNYEAAFGHLAPLHGKIFNEIRTKDIQAVIDSSDKSKSTKEKIKLLCNLLYKYALENDISSKNYAQFVKLDKEDKKEKEIFSDEEIKIFFENDNIPYVDTILILIYTGMRISELLSLKKTDVDLAKKTIVGGLKTEAGRNRVIPIHDKVFKYIKKWYDSSVDMLFFKGDNARLTSKYYREYIYYPILEKLGIPRRSPHCTRHTFATLLARSGADTNAIKQILGHTKYSFTADTYTHVDTKFLSDEMNKLK